jgi:outer membrane protein OmpA-like peptidoglycan-associated protein
MKPYLVACLLPLLLAGCISSDVETEYPIAAQKADLRDYDSDGVINERDTCTTTPNGSKISNDGCESFYQTDEQKLLKVLFDNDSTDIPSIFATQITEMVTFLEEYPDTEIELQGFASKPGNHEHNMWLSQERAKSVQKMMVSKGVDIERLTIVGFGDSKAVHDGQADQALDRKVVATVVGFKGDVVKEWHIFTTRAK